MQRFHWYAIWLTFICIGVFILQLVVPGLTEAFLLTPEAWSQPWRFVTSLFAHGDMGHILYNGFALALFGSILESIIGGRRFLFVFFGTGVIANLVGVFVYPASLGASGAIFGVIGVLVMLRPLLVVWAFGLPMPLFIAGLLWVTGDIIGTFNPTSTIGTVAHLVGIASGLIIGTLLRPRFKERRIRWERARIDERTARDWEDRYLLRD